MDLFACLRYLVPNAQCGTTDDDYDKTEWNDPRPMPTLAECEAVWPLVQAMADTERWNASIRAQLDALDARYGVRALTEAMDGDSTRLDWLKAEKAKLRAQLQGVSEVVVAPAEDA